MAYDKKKIFEQAKEMVVKHNLFFIEDIVAFIPCGRSWFYENFKDGTDEMDTIKEMLEQNKIKTKSGIRAKLWKSEKAAELLALYRLIATPEEHRKLNQSYIGHSVENMSIQWNEVKTYEGSDKAD